MTAFLYSSWGSHSLLQWNRCFRTIVLEKTLESSMERKELKPVNLKGNQPRILFGRTDAEAKAPVLWPPDVNSWLIGRDPDAGKDWRQNKKVTEDEMVEWHHWFNGHELGQALGDGEGQGSLVCCSTWDCEELYSTWWLNNSNSNDCIFKQKVWKSLWKTFAILFT